MDGVKKQKLLEKMAQQYKTMDSDQKQELLNKKVHKYKSMDAAKNKKYLRSGNKNSIVFVIMKLQIRVLKSLTGK